MVPAAELSTREVAAACAGSGFFADSRDAGQAIVKMAAARELGMGPMAGMTGVYIVKGRVTLSANLMAAAIQKSGTHRYRVRKHTNQECSIEFFEKEADGTWESLATVTFTEADAKAAGLSSGDNWRKYPKNMLFARAMSNGAKWHTPGVFAGNPVYTPDELDSSAEMTEEGDFVVKAAITSPPPASSEEEDDGDDLVTLCRKAGTTPERVARNYNKRLLSDLNAEERKNAEKLLKAKQEV